MWMISVPEITFEYFGNFYVIKGQKPLTEYPNFMEMKISEDMTLDEICVQSHVFGEDSESLAHILFEANVVELVDNKFSLKGIQKLRIPL